MEKVGRNSEWNSNIKRREEGALVSRNFLGIDEPTPAGLLTFMRGNEGRVRKGPERAAGSGEKEATMRRLQLAKIFEPPLQLLLEYEKAVLYGGALHTHRVHSK